MTPIPTGEVLLLEVNPDPALAMFDIVPETSLPRPAAADVAAADGACDATAVPVVTPGSVVDEFDVPGWAAADSTSLAVLDRDLAARVAAVADYDVRVVVAGNVDDVDVARLALCKPSPFPNPVEAPDGVAVLPPAFRRVLEAAKRTV